ncbi:MAG: DUF6585 family protein [Chloroflexota bacterium]
MPQNRPMPLSGDTEIPTDPLLGKPVDNFPGRRLRALLIGWPIFIATSLLFNYAFIDVNAFWVAPLVVVTVGFIGLIIGWWVLHQWNREVILYEYGFSYREGSENVPFQYTEVAAIRLRAEQVTYFFGVFRRVIYRIHIRMVNGDRIRLDNTYSRVEKMSDEISKQVYTLLRPVYRAKLNEGEPITFADDLYMTADGLHVSPDAVENAPPDDLFLPWEQSGGYRVASGNLNLLRSDGAVWFVLPLREIDNLVLLLEFVREKQRATQEPVS